MRLVQVVIAGIVASVAGHAGMVSPTSRNSNDRFLPDFQGGKSPDTPCTCANGYDKQYPSNGTAATTTAGTCWTDKGMNYNDHAHNMKVFPHNVSIESVSR